MTEERLNEILARVKGATPGPWAIGDGSEKMFFQGWDTVQSKDRVIAERAVYHYHDPDDFDRQVQRDLVFIAHARQDIPDLLDALVIMAQRDIPCKVKKQRTPVGNFMCPNCGVAFIYSLHGGPIFETPYCGNCGQALDWDTSHAD